MTLTYMYRFYCLPDLYEIQDSALDDIREALNPTYIPKDIEIIDKNDTLASDVNGIAYLPGYIGLNDLGKTDFINVVIHSLAHVTPLRDYFLVRPQLTYIVYMHLIYTCIYIQLPSNYEGNKDVVVNAFGELIRKVGCLPSRDSNMCLTVFYRSGLHIILKVSLHLMNSWIYVQRLVIESLKLDIRVK